MGDTKKKLFEFAITNGDTKQKYVAFSILGFPLTFSFSAGVKWIGILITLAGIVYNWLIPYYNDFKSMKVNQEILLQNDSIQKNDVAEIKKYIAGQVMKDERDRIVDSTLKANNLTSNFKDYESKKIKIGDKVYTIPNNALGDRIEELLRSGNNKQ